MKILVYGLNYAPELTGIGKYTGANRQQSGESLKGVTSIANPGTAQGTKYFYIMLTTVVEGDQGSEVIAPHRYASPLRNSTRNPAANFSRTFASVASASLGLSKLICAPARS